MKKPSHVSPAKKKVPTRRMRLDSPNVLADNDGSVNEANLADEQFTVVTRGEEASSSGHRVEPIKIDPEEDNAETLIEEGLHGYRHAVSKKSPEGR